MEHTKAQKKIHETAKKTDELVMLRKRNDERFMRVSHSANLNIIKRALRNGLITFVNFDYGNLTLTAILFKFYSNKWSNNRKKSRSDREATRPLRVLSRDASRCKTPVTTCMFQRCRAHSLSKAS